MSKEKLTQYGLDKKKFHNDELANVQDNESNKADMMNIDLMNIDLSTSEQVAERLQITLSQDFKTISKRDLFCLYGIMLHARMFEETCSVLYTSKYIAGFCHLYSGQEAVAVGIQSILERGDNTITAYRCHVHAIISRMMNKVWKVDFACESANQIANNNKNSKDQNENDQDLFEDIQAFITRTSQAYTTLAELMGKQNGCSKGKGGSMHLYDPEYNFYGGHGIVGIQIPLGAGLAFADKYRGLKHVTFASLGDGAMNQGQVYEAFNMAQLWKLPVVFVLENNGYAIGTAMHRSCAGDGLYKRALGFGIPSFRIDGMNILEVRKAAKAAKEYAIEKGPVFLEMDTYRYRPHSMSDPATYRTRDEVTNIKQTRDPIEFVKAELIKMGANEEDFVQYEEAEQARIEEIVENCKQAPVPGVEELESDIWATPLD